MAYRPRSFSKNPLYRLLQDHWESFLGVYEEEFQHIFGALRSVTERVVEKFMDCGNPLNGFARIRCPECGYERLLAFSCKSRFCPSCQARRAEEWAFWLCENRLEGVPHHHVVFTIPKMLRAYFRFDRSLLNELSRAAHRAVLTYCEGLLDEGVRPGVIVRQTFGEGARFHPHLHVLLTGGGWDAGGAWRPIFGWDRPVLRELFTAEVFRFLREKELLSRERMQLIRSWRHSGFGVYVGEAIGAGDRETLEHVARYLLRAPVSLERLWYNPEAGTVTIRPLAGEGEKPVELGAQEFIARLITHIPDYQERQVIYYGAYANASALQREHRRAREEQEGALQWAPPAEEPTPFERRCRMRWAQLIRRVWLEDPLLCPNCGGEMRIIIAPGKAWERGKSM